MNPSIPEYIPTPEEIEAACAEIRAEWPAEEFARRWTGPATHRWRPPGWNRNHAMTDRDNNLDGWLGDPSG